MAMAHHGGLAVQAPRAPGAGGGGTGARALSGRPARSIQLGFCGVGLRRIRTMASTYPSRLQAPRPAARQVRRVGWAGRHLAQMDDRLAGFAPGSDLEFSRGRHLQRQGKVGSLGGKVGRRLARLVGWQPTVYTGVMILPSAHSPFPGPGFRLAACPQQVCLLASKRFALLKPSIHLPGSLARYNYDR